MRDALRESRAAVKNPVDRYPAGSVIVCASCGRPLYRLESGINVGDRVGQAIAKLKPVTPADLRTLAARSDVHPGTRGWINEQSHTDLLQYCELIPVLHTGDPAICEKCGHTWVQVRTAEESDTADRAYTFELHFIPPDTTAAPMRRRGGSAFLR